MATVSELLEQLEACYVDLHCESFDHVTAAKLIEQALLAERRLAMETCAEIADNKAGKNPRRSKDWVGDDYDTPIAWAYDAAKEIAQALRAAAEKEVGK